MLYCAYSHLHIENLVKIDLSFFVNFSYISDFSVLDNEFDIVNAKKTKAFLKKLIGSVYILK